MTGRLPNFLYVGTDKAGSSWLHEVLIRHPQVFLTAAKDLYYFDRYYERGPAWYRDQFRGSGPEHVVVGEFCQDYLYAPDGAARIRHDLGEIELMVTLRDPVDRAFSSYLYMRKHGAELGTFRQALHSTEEFLDRGRYASYLGSYLQQFARERIHVTLFDDLKANPAAFVRDVQRRLGIAALPVEDDLLRGRLPASRARSLPAARLARRGSVWMRDHDHAEVVGRVKRSPLVQRLLYKPFGEQRPTVDPEDAAFIRNVLQDEVARAGALVGIDLCGRWGWRS